MLEMARLLAEDPCPRVTRFVRATTHTRDPEIQQLAKNYLEKNGPSPCA
jgi:hypothetical protein